MIISCIGRPSPTTFRKLTSGCGCGGGGWGCSAFFTSSCGGGGADSSFCWGCCCNGCSCGGGCGLTSSVGAVPGGKK